MEQRTLYPRMLSISKTSVQTSHAETPLCVWDLRCMQNCLSAFLSCLGGLPLSQDARPLNRVRIHNAG